jgi:hypothetical protein
MEIGEILFWGVVALVSVSAMWTSYLGRLEIEKTIRKAIDSGAVLDPPTVAQLKSSGGGQTPLFIVVAGVVIVAAGIGFAALALAMRGDAPDDFMAMLGVAALLSCTGGGVIVGGAWMLGRESRRFAD